MGLNSHMCAGRLRERLGAFARRRYATPKAMARDLGMAPKTAENIMADHWPGDLTLSRLMSRFGHDLVEALFAPDIEPVAARLRAEIREAEEQLAERTARYRAVAGAATPFSDTAGQGERRSPGGAPPARLRPTEAA